MLVLSLLDTRYRDPLTGDVGSCRLLNKTKWCSSGEASMISLFIFLFPLEVNRLEDVKSFDLLGSKMLV